MFHNPMTKSVVALLVGLIVMAFLPAHAATLDEDVAYLQHGWAEVYYRVGEHDKVSRFEALAEEARQRSELHAGKAEPMIWHAIILSSCAKFEGGLGALDKIKKARDELLAAEKIDPRVLEGSVYTSLGSLYAKAPGWPLSFGDKKKAADYLAKALAQNPTGIDPNYFYGDWLADQGRAEEARRYFEKALAAPARPGREDADAGRREEIRSALLKLKA